MAETTFKQPQTELERAIAARVKDAVDPARRVNGKPGGGTVPVPHVVSFNGLVSAVSDVYTNADEAIKNSIANARYMRNDLGIMECVLARERMVALLDWHLEPEDEKSTEQKQLCESLTKILGRLRRFTEYRRCLMEAIWYGRSAVQHRWGEQRIGGQSFIMPSPEEGREHPGWLPINGDKLVFRNDLSWRSEAAGHFGQIGVLINRATLPQSIDVDCVEATNRGLAYFLPTWQRRLMAVHKHEIEDAAYESPLDAGAINGVGIRSRIYWEWFQKQEVLAYLLEYLERSASGIEVWEYPAGNDEAKRAVEAAALNRGAGNKNVLLFPKPPGEDAALFGVHLVEPGMAGADMLLNMVEKYFGHRVKRFILGQTLTSEADATGLGSGVADLHLDTLMQIIRYDARNLAETLTYQLLEPIKLFNFPQAAGIHVDLRIQTDDPKAQETLEAYKSAWDMGARLKESDVLGVIGASAVTNEDVILQNKQPQQGMGGEPGGQGQPQSLGGQFNRQASFEGLSQRIQAKLQASGIAV